IAGCQIHKAHPLGLEPSRSALRLVEPVQQRPRGIQPFGRPLNLTLEDGVPDPDPVHRRPILGNDRGSSPVLHSSLRPNTLRKILEVDLWNAHSADPSLTHGPVMSHKLAGYLWQRSYVNALNSVPITHSMSDFGRTERLCARPLTGSLYSGMWTTLTGVDLGLGRHQTSTSASGNRSRCPTLRYGMAFRSTSFLACRSVMF